MEPVHPEENSSPRLFHVYALVDPLTGLLRYVGITSETPAVRRNRHIRDSRRKYNQPVSRWIRKLLAKEEKPIVVCLEQTTEWSRECFWIAHYRAAGLALLNCTEGGEGTAGYKHSAESRAKMSAGQTGKKRGPMSQEHKDKIGASHRGVPNKPKTPEVRAKQSSTCRERGIRPPQLTSEQLRAYKLGSVQPEATRKKRSESLRRFYEERADDAWRASHPKKFTPENHHQSKVTHEQVREMRTRYSAGGITGKELAAEYGITPASANRIIRGEVYRHVPYPELASLRPTDHGRKFAGEQVRTIRALYAAGGISYRALGRQFGTSGTVIQRIITRVYYQDVN